MNHHLTCCFILTEAPSFAEPGDAIMEKVANSEVTIPCPAEGTKRFSDDSAQTDRKLAMFTRCDSGF